MYLIYFIFNSLSLIVLFGVSVVIAALWGLNVFAVFFSFILLAVVCALRFSKKAHYIAPKASIYTQVEEVIAERYRREEEEAKEAIRLKEEQKRAKEEKAQPEVPSAPLSEIQRCILREKHEKEKRRKARQREEEALKKLS